MLKDRLLVLSSKSVTVEGKEYASLQVMPFNPSSLVVDGFSGHAVQNMTAMPAFAKKLGSSNDLPVVVDLELEMKAISTKTQLVAVSGTIVESTRLLFSQFMQSLLLKSNATSSSVIPPVSATRPS